MNGVIVRIASIEIHNFKNVISGTLEFDNLRKKYNASILGLYGQNGSGKTALIDALTLLKCALSGRSIPASYGECIHIDADYAELNYQIKIEDIKSNTKYHVIYSFRLKKEQLTPDEIMQDPQQKEKYRIVLFDEYLGTSYQNETKKQRQQLVVDTRTNESAFLPKTKYDILTGGNKTVATDLLVARKLAAQTAKSFIFSSECQKIIRENCSEEYLKFMMRSLTNYGKSELFVINTKSTAIISLNGLPLSFKYNDKDWGAFGEFSIPLWEASTVPDHILDILQKIIDNMNIVLEQLIPGLTIGIVKLGEQLMEDGAKAHRIQLVSLKNKKAIPLQFESEGIKKIISILQLLIVVYNHPSITVAIDELDAGIFEYLLGELLKIISEKGKGQLIFTSHNLRPLETIDRGFIAFTTMNPENRYIRLSNVKSNNNLRDFYYRDIILGEQNETVYDPTNNYEIALAFREAGENLAT